jgi:uncharacterized Zn finger protein
MQWAVDFELRDEYDLCYGLEEFWKRRFSKKDWSSLADRLLSRLNDMKNEGHEDSFSRNYRRDRLTNEIIRALGNAGREEEVISLCLKEAEKNHSYERWEQSNGRTHYRSGGMIRKGISEIVRSGPVSAT